MLTAHLAGVLLTEAMGFEPALDENPFSSIDTAEYWHFTEACWGTCCLQPFAHSIVDAYLDITCTVPLHS